MARKENAEQKQYPPEFMNWLKDKKVRRRQWRRNPEMLQSLHKEWLSSTPRKRKKPFSLFSRLSSIDLDQLNHHLSNASKMLSTIQSLRSITSSSKGNETEDDMV